LRTSNRETINPGTVSHIDDTPQSFAGKGGKDLYLAHMLFSLNRWDWLISNLQDSGDLRVVPFTRALISKISDKELKIRVLKTLNDDIHTIRGNTAKNTLEKNQKILEVCQNAISVVYDHLIANHVINELQVIVPMVQDPPDGDIGDADSIPAEAA
jgi:hypothetical protein